MRGMTFTRAAANKASTGSGSQQTMTIDIPLAISADTGNNAITQLQNILTKAREAIRGSGGYGLGTTVYLWVRLVGSSSYVYYTVTSAAWDPVLPGAGMVTLNRLLGSLSLTCLPYAHGDVVTDPVSTVLTATSPTPYRAGIPGDVEALTRLWVTDLSANNQIAVGFTLLSRSVDAMGASDFTPTDTVSVAGSGTSLADTSALGGAAASLRIVWPRHACEYRALYGPAHGSRGGRKNLPGT